jgi:5-methylcytosine-specific restriction endonuclease McrA
VLKLFVEFDKNTGNDYGFNNQCKVCRKAYAVATANSDVRRASRIRQQMRYQENRTKRLAVMKAWHTAHPEAVRIAKRRYAVRHREKVLERARGRARVVYVADPDKFKARAKQRRHKLRNVPGEVTAQEWRDRLAEYNYHCAYCLKPLEEGGDTTQDHMQSIVNGGTHVIENIVPACRSCNSRKQWRSLLQWYLAIHTDAELLSA